MSFDSKGLLEPQIPHARKLIDSLYTNGVAVDLSETGCGKTYAASAVARAMNAPLIVIAPKMVIPVWERILKKFGIKATLLINYEKICRGNTIHLKYLRCKKDERWINAKVKFPAGSLVILDESHKGKGVNSLNAGLFIALKRQGYRVLCLSASQATNPLEMKAFGYLFGLHNLKDFKDFTIEYGAEWLGRWGAQTFNLDSKEAQNKMRMLHENLFNHQQCASRLTRNDMKSYFTDNQIVSEAYDMGPNSHLIKTAYDKMESEIARLEESFGDYSNHIFAIITAARRRVEMLKIPTLVEMTEDLYAEGKSVVVFLNFTESIEAMADKLSKYKTKIGFVYGGRSIKNRISDVEEFQADAKRILLTNLQAGGQSLSLHDLNGNYPRASLINPSFSAVNVLQATGRIHRVEGKTPCYQRFVFALGHGIEENMSRRLHFRLQNLSMLNDGDLRGEANWFKYVVGKSI